MIDRRNFVCREDVLAVFENPPMLISELRKRIESLPSFPAPNPNWQNSDRNVMGQTEEEFWAKVESQYPAPTHFRGSPEC